MGDGGAPHMECADHFMLWLDGNEAVWRSFGKDTWVGTTATIVPALRALDGRSRPIGMKGLLGGW